MESSLTPVRWAGSSRRDLRAFPLEARNALGFELELVQRGQEPTDWKPMPSVGMGVREIRARIGGAWRMVYVTRLEDRIWVLHVFQKKTQRTAKSDLDVARRRLREAERIVREERDRGG
jgi:phage-related protein